MLISIITVTRNDFCGLNETIKSLNYIDSDFRQYFEHIIVDGLSTDESLSYLNNYILNPILNTSLVSERDKGIYDAMNKGVKRSKGEYCFFLNSGDIIDNNVDFSNMMKVIEENYKKLNSCGIALNVKMSNDGVFHEVKARSVRKYRLRMPTVHQGIVYKTDYLKKYKYDDTLNICSDFKSVVTALELELYFEPINQQFTILTYGGISSQRPFMLLKESLTIVKNSSLGFLFKMSSGIFIATNVILFQFYFKILALIKKK